MKLTYPIAGLLFLITSLSYAQVGINIVVPHESSILDIISTNKGVLFPRVDIVNLNTPAPITNPATSLFVWNNHAGNEGYYYWSGSKWIAISGKSWSLSGNDTTTDPNTFLGTINNRDLIFKANNMNVGVLYTDGRISIGNYQAQAPGGWSISIGQSTTATGSSSVAVGRGTKAGGTSSVSIGYDSNAAAAKAVAIGDAASASGDLGIAIGVNAKANAHSVALGQTSDAAQNSIAIGSSSQAIGVNSIALGVYAKSSGPETIALGQNALANGNFSAAIGSHAVVNANGFRSMAIGYAAMTDQANSIILGNSGAN